MQTRSASVFVNTASLVALWCCLAACSDRVAAAENKPVLLYCRYFNAEGEDRYSADTTYKDVLAKLRETFEVRVDAEPLTAKALADVKLVLIANPNDKAAPGHNPPHHFSARDIEVLSSYVKDGGGLIFLGNQENHNLETEDTNKLLVNFGIKFVNDYTDAKKLTLPADTSIIGGLRWAYYTGNRLLVSGYGTSHARCLVGNDLAQKPMKGPRDHVGCLMATAEPGKGRVMVSTDAGWIANFALNEEGVGGVAIKGQDNWEIFRRLALWTAHQ